MTPLQFVASLIGSLALPVAAVTLALIFRRQLERLLSGQLRRVRAGPVEVEFERVMSRVEGELAARSTSNPESIGKAPESDLVTELAEIALIAPLAAVEEGYAAIEREVRRLGAAAAPTEDSETPTMKALVSVLLRDGVIDATTANSIEGIGVLRSLAIQGRPDELTTIRALDYLALVEAIRYTLRQAKAPGAVSGSQ